MVPRLADQIDQMVSSYKELDLFLLTEPKLNCRVISGHTSHPELGKNIHLKVHRELPFNLDLNQNKRYMQNKFS